MSRRGFVLSSAGALLAASLGKRAAASPRPNIILIVLDTVRADHIGPSLWGYTRRTAPCLESFSREATVYGRAYSTAPWTLPAHATLFTGQYSFQHGVEGILQKDAQGKEDILDPPLPDSALTAAEILRTEGYTTGAFTANVAYMSAWCNLGQGFDTYEVKRQPGVKMLPPIMSWVAAHRTAPFFLFVNIMDAHYPYNTKPCPGAFDEPVSQDPTLIHQLFEAVMPGVKPADESLAKAVTAQYDMGIANADTAAGRLLDALKAAGVYDNALVIVASDHGEFLGEHFLVSHSKDLYEQVLWVPLLVKSPGQRKGLRQNRPVSLVQICRTMLDVAGATHLPRKSVIAPSIEAAAPLLAEINYTRHIDFVSPKWGKRFHRTRTAYYDFPWKLIYSSDGHHELYDVEQDPGESVNRFDQIPERRKQMMDRMAAIKPLQPATPPAPPSAPPRLNEQERDALKANGYF